MTIEERLYALLCKGCPQEKMCHDTCEYCEEYLKGEEELDKQKINQL